MDTEDHVIDYWDYRFVLNKIKIRDYKDYKDYLDYRLSIQDYSHIADPSNKTLLKYNINLITSIVH